MSFLGIKGKFVGYPFLNYKNLRKLLKEKSVFLTTKMAAISALKLFIDKRSCFSDAY